MVKNSITPSYGSSEPGDLWATVASAEGVEPPEGWEEFGRATDPETGLIHQTFRRIGDDDA